MRLNASFVTSFDIHFGLAVVDLYSIFHNLNCAHWVLYYVHFNLSVLLGSPRGDKPPISL